MIKNMGNRLNEIIISVTNRCNLRCRMCQIPFSGNAGMSTVNLKDLISDAVNLHPSSIVFSGGEPLLRGDIFELISFAGRHKINTCLVSNGTLINDETAGKLASSGIGVVNISIEGPEDIHDFLRGRGNYRKACEALRHLSRHKIETTIAAVVCKYNYKSLPYVMGLAGEFGITTVKFQPFNDIFLIEKDRKKDFFLSPDKAGDVNDSIQEVIELSRKHKISTNPRNYLERIPEYLCGILSDSRDNHCQALRSSCPISPDGDVYPCWVLSDRIVGNVREGGLSELWNSDRHTLICRQIAEEGCPGCLMSCYDSNLGKYGLSQAFLIKTKKLRKAAFYRRFYYRNYQFFRYILNKIVSRIVDIISSRENDNSKIAAEVREIKLAKQLLKKRIDALKK